MCWVSYVRPQLERCDKDIPIIKILHGNLHSLYFGFYYKLGKIYKQAIGPIESFYDTYEIRRGFHSYSPKIKLCIVGDWVNVFNINGTLPLDTTLNEDLIVVNGCIPEGSIYYVNAWGEYVSNRIVLTDIKGKLCVGKVNGSQV